jgi:hypothetical protein
VIAWLNLAGFPFFALGLVAGVEFLWSPSAASARSIGGFLSVAWSLWLVSDIVQGAWGHVGVDGFVLAVALWVWWNSGGGDGAKRRLREALKPFRPVRRTAPAVAS